MNIGQCHGSGFTLCNLIIFLPDQFLEAPFAPQIWFLVSKTVFMPSQIYLLTTSSLFRERLFELEWDGRRRRRLVGVDEGRVLVGGADGGDAGLNLAVHVLALFVCSVTAPAMGQ